MFHFGFAKMFSAATFETYFHHKPIWIAATDYYMHINIIILSPLKAIFQLRNFKASELLVY